MMADLAATLKKADDAGELADLSWKKEGIVLMDNSTKTPDDFKRMFSQIDRHGQEIVTAEERKEHLEKTVSSFHSESSIPIKGGKIYPPDVFCATDVTPSGVISAPIYITLKETEKSLLHGIKRATLHYDPKEDKADKTRMPYQGENAGVSYMNVELKENNGIIIGGTQITFNKTGPSPYSGEIIQKNEVSKTYTGEDGKIHRQTMFRTHGEIHFVEEVKES
jgi:hypothetical protein